ncbi:hypothetical protein F4824DRAFT_510343 [Ustulina deusta]|nr:hypothetical protein F4824DRAFT_510343 [Ustulina deusta]
MPNFSCCKDKAGADLVNKFTDDCAERHGGQCISHFRDKVEWGLVLTASKGHAEAFLAVLPHCGPSSDVLNERLLSAPISGKHPTIMDLVTLMRLNINPHPRTFYPSYKDLDEDEREHGTTPLVESIAVGNTKFINILACAGIFKSLHDGGRFEVAIEVAIEAAVTGGNYELVAHLLDSCPNLESHPIARALQIAIAKGYQDIALMILRRGASTSLKDQEMCDLILGSKLATLEFLTVCLAAAVFGSDASLARKLIEKGANAADNTVLLCAI